MGTSNTLAYYLEDLWSKGFKLSDEEVRFIYFGQKYTNTSDRKVILAVKTTLRLQYCFDGSFYLSLLELLDKESISNNKQASDLLRDKGLYVNIS